MKNHVTTENNYIVRENRKKYKTEKVSFLSHISHGIRTPLNSIIGFSKLLVLKDMVNPKQREYIQGIMSGSNLLLQFVDNIMDLSQFEADNYSLRICNCDVNKVLWEFTEEFYNLRMENHETDINLMLVWDQIMQSIEIETDATLLKKALQRIINLVVEKYPITEFELGYRVQKNNNLLFYIRPSREKLSQQNFLNEHQLSAVDESNSFDYFNFAVLRHALHRLGGNLITDSDKQEFSFELPVKYSKVKKNI